jgi:enamine deaminase RidA (YjgF/YER057c/UK114 family)
MRCLALVALLAFVPAAAAEVKCIEPSARAGTSQAVVVGAHPLAHTAQVLPVSPSGDLVGKGKLGAQVEQVLDNLAHALTAGGASLAQVVKLNVYAASDDDVPTVEAALARRFTGKIKPAVCYVTGTMSHPDVLVSMDAVAVSTQKAEAGKVRRGASTKLAPGKEGAHVAVLPAGPVVYVSGQAERGGTLAEATRKTLASLRATLRFLDLDETHVVQVRSFVHPMTKLDEVRNEITAYFGKERVPPLVFVEWTFARSIEIELIAAAPALKRKPASAVELLTPPGMTASPIFSRVARINHGQRIYLSGLYGQGAGGEAQVKDLFGTLGGLLAKAGSDFRHLVKATYYVSTEDASKQLNVLRPRYYDPKRPPAASKAQVRGTGRAGRGITLDMIAVAAPK